MDRTRLPDDIRALNARLTADPASTETMGPVHVLTVVGRRSGRPQATPVSPVTYDGHRWLVAGWADADWVKNLRASGRIDHARPYRLSSVLVPEPSSARAAG